ncbi:MAG: acetyl-CoA C-acetyltransferase [Mycobacterium sp.]
MSTQAFVYDAIRTPRGKGKRGALHGTKPISLVIGLIEDLLARHPDLDTDRIDDLVLGVVMPVGDQGSDIARTAVTASSLPVTVGGVQLNRFCGSGLSAVNLAAAQIRAGWESLVIAGGVESMSRVPISSDGGAMALDPATSYDTHFIPQGVACDLLATIEGVTRADADAYAVQSQQRAAAAWTGGYFAKSIVPVRDQNGVVILDHDEHMRPQATVESLAKLPPAFATIGELAGFDAVAMQKFHWVEKISHIHHAGNSSGIVDGAGLVLVGSEQAGADMGMTPRARIISAATSGDDATLMFRGPIPSTQKALDIAGFTVDDIDLFEVNEAFATVPIMFANHFGVPMDRINVNGGSIAFGHPLGATGAMLLGTIVDELERRELRRGLVTLCVAGGMGVATIVERV